MASVTRFEDLLAWQRARELTREIHKATMTGAVSRDYSFLDQIRSAASSVMSNIAEGFERGNPAEFHQFLVIAKGSCGETRSHLYTALDVGYLSKKEWRQAHWPGHLYRADCWCPSRSGAEAARQTEEKMKGVLGEERTEKSAVREAYRGMRTA